MDRLGERAGVGKFFVPKKLKKKTLKKKMYYFIFGV